jgi:3-hydroxymyristoyl/3-hydroxydecanoyl-(acyl carrier protein) dehydratase
MKPEQFEPEELIPQRPPMMMVDRLIECSETLTKSRFFIKEDNIFCNNGYFTESGLIENIAQTAAARIGYLSKNSEQKVLIGYIGAIKDLNIYFFPNVSTEILTEVTIENEILGFTIIHGKVLSNNSVAAECNMTIFIKQ